MSFLTADSFIYNGEDSNSYGLEICWIDDEPSLYNINREINHSENNIRIKNNVYGARAIGNISISFYIVKKDGTELTKSESLAINKWLFGNSTPKKLSFNDGEIISYHYYSVCTSVEDIIIGGARHIGKKINFESNSPYAFTDITKYKYSISEKKCINHYIEFQSLDGYYYPIFNITSVGNVKISNSTTSTCMDINLSRVNGGMITIDNNNMTIVDKNGSLIPLSLIVSDIDNFEWIKFKSGKNELILSGEFELTIINELPVIAGGL